MTSHSQHQANRGASLITKTAMVLLVIFLLACFSGCTTSATRQAISSYEKAEAHKQAAFDNLYRMSNEQLFLATSQYLRANLGNPDAIQLGLEAAFTARSQLEVARMEYERGRALTRLTVGQYLYDQQGWLSSLFEAYADSFQNTTDAMGAANSKAGVSDVRDVLPDLLQQMPIFTRPLPQ